MSQPPYIAVVIEGGLIQTVITEHWPNQLPPPRIVVVDYDKEGSDDELTQFSIGDEIMEALCHIEVPSSFEAFDKPSLSPRVVLTALGEPEYEPVAESPLSIAQAVRQSIIDLDQQLMQQEQPPTGDDYKQLYVLASNGLIDVLKALGDSSVFCE
ncbi:hypothetical protein OGV25_21095 [Pseudomonas sp. P1B16]|uniref:Uncharacterized protein n=2 Tax=Pseudomonas TaxID=286 RepID=A0A6G6ISV0_PSENT|nr:MULTISPECIES: hypothetical protein [Pseudomonas]KYO76861.1 hypothetical protein LT18_04948 [Pseudomonas aeruginosa]NWD82476.1 hypothetical protein [Pseudomonas reactans]NWE91156.1 hypothetical protein [Pseudomonas reactans]QIE86072.1 hypothetical protein G5B91_07255 [Pseudomonas nitroreducens]WPM25664.1 hypothetical protein OGV25_21095 [Pseudomonas sp. P1B16]